MRAIARCCVLLSVLLLSACGGGGGSGGGTDAVGGATASSENGPVITFDQNAVSSKYEAGDSPVPMTITAHASRAPSGPFYVSAAVVSETIDPRIPVSINGLSATISPSPASGLAPGVYTGQLILRACPDPYCQTTYSGTPKTIQYTITVLPRLVASTTAVSLAAGETGIAAPQALTISQLVPGQSLTIKTDDGGSGWLNVIQQDPQTFQIGASAAQLKSGAYTGNVTFTSSDGVQYLSVPVSLTVSSGIVVPQALSMKIDAATTTLDTVALMSVQSASTTGFRWSATTSTPWIKLTSASGNTGAALAWHLDLPTVDGLPNNASYDGYIHLTSDQGIITPVDIHIALSKQLPEVHYIAPFNIQSTGPAVVRVRGGGFDAIPDLLRAVRFGSVAPLSVKRINDTSLVVALPSMPAGNYAAQIKVLGGLTTITSSLQSIDPQTYPYAAISTNSLLAYPASLPDDIYYDPTRKMVLMQNMVNRNTYNTPTTNQTNLIEYQFNGSTWTMRKQISSDVDGIGFTPDGKYIVSLGWVDNYNTSVNLTSIDSLTVDSRATVASALFGTGVGLVVTNDAKLLMGLDTGGASALNLFDLRTHQVIKYGWTSSTPFDYRNYTVDFAFVTGDGEQIVTGWEPGKQTSQLIADASDGLVKNPQFSSPVFVNGANMDGSRFYGGQSILDPSGTVLGSWDMAGTLGPNWVEIGGAFSADGMVYYDIVYPASVMGDMTEPALTASSPKPRVYVWDLSKADAKGQYPLKGYFEFADYPGCRVTNIRASTGNSDCSVMVLTKVAPDNKTIFMLGRRNFVVAPIPGVLTPY